VVTNVRRDAAHGQLQIRSLVRESGSSVGGEPPQEFAKRIR
jgi:hypothetical protein